MYIDQSPQPSRRKFSLTLRVSALLVLAVVLPLLITVISSELILRPTLLSQAASEMGNDAQTHANTIDSFFIGRIQNIEALGHFLAIQKYLSGDELFKQQALSELALGNHLDANSNNWALFDTRGEALLAYPALPVQRGNYTVLAPDITAHLLGGEKSIISDVYFDTQTHTAFVDIYTSITSKDGELLGFGRSTIRLNDIWTAVNNETNAAQGSYAMILDGHGVRVAYTSNDITFTTLPQTLFKAVAPLSPTFQQRVKNENIYNTNNTSAMVLADKDLAAHQQDPHGVSVFQLVPATQAETFQAYRVKCQVLPWSYIVLRPVNTVINAANTQDLYLFLIAAVIMLIAAIVGLFVGRSITRPILYAVNALKESSQLLNTLATSEQVMATEQRWIVESSQTGLQAVQYYVGATSVAARKLDELIQDLGQNWDRLAPAQKQQRLQELRMTANYIEKAASHQERSSKSLATAIQVVNQVTEQLVSGATSAADASTQLEQVIEKLRRVVGQ